MRLLTVGPLWRGSNAGGLFRAFARAGCQIDVIDEFYYISFRSKSMRTRIAERAIRSWQIAEFNRAIIQQISLFQPDVLFVYKGAFVYPETLQAARDKKIMTALFYPDVSLTAHGSYIARSLPLYDRIFTTKTYGINDIKQHGGTDAVFVPHGFDPEIHRKLDISEKDRAVFGCDASFIGTWSPKKEKWLAHLKRQLPDINLAIWGEQWNRSTTPELTDSIRNKPVLGDLYALTIQCSTINLAILSEIRQGSSSGDLITSRTFHIPGANGFMMHERNAESIMYFEEGKEAVFFDDEQEMAAQVAKYLGATQEREQIRAAGHLAATTKYSLDHRATEILSCLR
jgi:spore maturation protein CgeB